MPKSYPSILCFFLHKAWASLIAQLVKNPPAMWETWVRSLDWKDPLEKGRATHSSILAWRIPCTSPWGCKESDTTQRLSFSLMLVNIRYSVFITVENTRKTES